MPPKEYWDRIAGECADAFAPFKPAQKLAEDKPQGRLRWRHRGLPQIHTGAWVPLSQAQGMITSCQKIYGDYITYVVEVK